jgi:replicative DNA helicase
MTTTRIRTGLIDLDTLLGGLAPGLVIIAADTAAGKTSLALNIARNAAVGQGSRVAIFSLELSPLRVQERLLSSESGVDSSRLRLGQHTEVE